MPLTQIPQSMLSQPLTQSTAQNTTSGTSIDFTGIPSWAKRVTVMLNGVSTNGSSNFRLQIGTISGIETTGYFSVCSQLSSTAIGTGTSTSGFDASGDGGAGGSRSGILVLCSLGGNIWLLTGSFNYGSGAFHYVFSGNKTLSAALERIRITTTGADTFDAGSVNILYE